MAPRTTWAHLPDGLTLAELDSYARERENARRREDYHRHPERVERHRLTTYTNYLNRHGKLVISMPQTPPPWDNELVQRCILHAVEDAMREQGGEVNA